MPNFSNDRPLVLEADLEPGETKEEAWTRINQDMIAWHKKEYPHLYEQTSPVKSFFVQTEPQYGGSDSSQEQQDEAAVQLGKAIKEMQKIQYKEDAEVFLSTEKWMKYNKELKSLLNAKPSKNG